MVERKSKPRKKKDEDEEPTGMRAVVQNPWYILVMYLSLIPIVVGILFGLSTFLSRGILQWWLLVPAAVAAVLFTIMALLVRRFK